MFRIIQYIYYIDICACHWRVYSYFGWYPSWKRVESLPTLGVRRQIRWWSQAARTLWVLRLQIDQIQYCGWLQNPNHQLIDGKHPVILFGFQPSFWRGGFLPSTVVYKKQAHFNIFPISGFHEIIISPRLAGENSMLECATYQIFAQKDTSTVW